VLVKNVQELESPDPPIFEQLLDLADAEAGDGATAGVGSRPTAGVGANDRSLGLREVEWEVDSESRTDDSSSGISSSLSPPLVLDDLHRETNKKGRKRKRPDSTLDEKPGETQSILRWRQRSLTRETSISMDFMDFLGTM
jgi:hypothetical protein